MNWMCSNCGEPVDCPNPHAISTASALFWNCKPCNWFDRWLEMRNERDEAQRLHGEIVAAYNAKGERVAVLEMALRELLSQAVGACLDYGPMSDAISDARAALSESRSKVSDR